MPRKSSSPLKQPQAVFPGRRAASGATPSPQTPNTTPTPTSVRGTDVIDPYEHGRQYQPERSSSFPAIPLHGNPTRRPPRPSTTTSATPNTSTPPSKKSPTTPPNPHLSPAKPMNSSASSSTVGHDPTQLNRPGSRPGHQTTAPSSSQLLNAPTAEEIIASPSNTPSRSNAKHAQPSSMGGESLLVGLNHPGSTSPTSGAGGLGQGQFDKEFPTSPGLRCQTASPNNSSGSPAAPKTASSAPTNPSSPRIAR